MKLYFILIFYLFFTFSGFSQDTLILRANILTENMIVYKDSLAINKIGEIKQDYGVFLLAPNQFGYFLVYRNGVLGYASKSFIDVKGYVANKLTYTNLDWKLQRVKVLDSIENIQILKKLKSELAQNQKELDNIIAEGNKKGIIVSSFETLFEDYKAGFSVTVENFKKTKIKYSYLTVSGYNDVKDIESTKTFKCIGPIEYLKASNYVFEDAFYTKVISELRIRKLVVEYFDGTTKTFEGATLKNIININD